MTELSIFVYHTMWPRWLPHWWELQALSSTQRSLPESEGGWKGAVWAWDVVGRLSDGCPMQSTAETAGRRHQGDQRALEAVKREPCLWPASWASWVCDPVVTKGPMLRRTCTGFNALLLPS